jgi:hypothetical protein
VSLTYAVHGFTDAAASDGAADGEAAADADGEAAASDGGATLAGGTLADGEPADEPHAARMNGTTRARERFRIAMSS